MSNFMTIRIQLGVKNYVRFTKTVLQDTTVEELRMIIREHENMQPSWGVVLISNGKPLKNPDLTLADHGICNDSLVICIISKQTGRDIELLFGDEEKMNPDQNVELETVLDCTFHARPFGFAVWANENGENAVVTKVSGVYAVDSGIKVGYCVYKLNDQLMFNRKHNEVLDALKNLTCPLRISFLDLGLEYVITFPNKPLDFTVIPDREDNNARVSKIDKVAVASGVRIGSHIIAVNDEDVFGLKHNQIMTIINNVGFPIKFRFRHPPKLLMMSSKTKKSDTTQ